MATLYLPPALHDALLTGGARLNTAPSKLAARILDMVLGDGALMTRVADGVKPTAMRQRPAITDIPVKLGRNGLPIGYRFGANNKPITPDMPLTPHQPTTGGAAGAWEDIGQLGASRMHLIHVKLCLHRYGDKAWACFERNQKKIIQHDGTYNRARVLEIARHYAEVDWKTTRHASRERHPNEFIGKRIGLMTIIGVVDKFNPPPGAEALRDARGSWGIYLCDCGDVSYHNLSTWYRAACDAPPSGVHFLPPGKLPACPFRDKNRRRPNVGRTFGRLLVLGIERDGNAYRYLCRCECGNECRPWASAVTSGNAKSCGCLKADSNHYRQDPTRRVAPPSAPPVEAPPALVAPAAPSPTTTAPTTTAPPTTVPPHPPVEILPPETGPRGDDPQTIEDVLAMMDEAMIEPEFELDTSYNAAD